eukprot:737796-Pyramimonas_sp.AAC.1
MASSGGGDDDAAFGSRCLWGPSEVVAMVACVLTATVTILLVIFGTGGDDGYRHGMFSSSWVLARGVEGGPARPARHALKK